MNHILGATASQGFLQKAEASEIAIVSSRSTSIIVGEEVAASVTCTKLLTCLCVSRTCGVFLVARHDGTPADQCVEACVVSIDLQDLRSSASISRFIPSKDCSQRRNCAIGMVQLEAATVCLIISCTSAGRIRHAAILCACTWCSSAAAGQLIAVATCRPIGATDIHVRRRAAARCAVESTLPAPGSS